jgi:hypothetical protein
VPGGASLDISSCPDSIERELADLRHQLESMKKQTLTVLEQSRKSSDREQAALRQAQESLELKETATANAARSVQRENYMLDLMTDASQDMAGKLLLPRLFPHCSSIFIPVLYCFFPLFLVGAFLDAAAEEQRVNARVESLTHLARANDIDFWADEARCRRIV